jgi:hypothetical protein
MTTYEIQRKDFSNSKTRYCEGGGVSSVEGGCPGVIDFSIGGSYPGVNKETSEGIM